MAWKLIACALVLVAQGVAGAVLLRRMMRLESLGVKERQAWFTLGIFAVTALAFGVVWSIVASQPRSSLMVATSTFWLYGFLGMTPWIGRREAREGRAVEDERDREIDKAATVAGYSVFWVAFVLACMAPFFVKGPNATLTIPTVVLTLPVYIGMIIVFTVRALVSVILYRRGRDGRQTA